MREEDKVLLFSEIFGVDTSLYVEKYIEELRSSDMFLKLCENIVLLRKKDCLRNRLIIEQFELIDFTKVKTMKDYFKLYAHICFLYDESENVAKINPLFYDKNIDKIEKLGEVNIEFDGRDITLNDMILDERYTMTYKIEAIKQIYLDYRREVKELLIIPFANIMGNQDVIKKDVSYRYKIYALLFVGILMNVIMIILPLFPSTLLRTLYSGQLDIPVIRYSFYSVLGTLAILDLALIMMFNVSLYKYRLFLRSYKVVSESYKIMDHIDKKCEDLYKIILKSINERKIIERKLQSVAFDYLEFKNVVYLIKISENYQSQSSKWRIPQYVIGMMIIFFMAFGVFSIVLLLQVGG